MINDFLNALAGEMPRCDAERLGAERYGAPRLSAFELLGTKENTLSDVIAELLDPRGAHGQGTLFLNALLHAIDEPIVHARDAIQVTREFMTKHRRRIDILIETPNSLVGIENKPFASQGENQLSDYYTDLVERAGKDRIPRLVFLSDSEPATAVDVTAVIRFYDWGDEYPSLCGLLDEVSNDIRAPRARAFIDDFRDWIARHFGGEDMTDELEPYAEEVWIRFADPHNRKAIGAVMLAGDRIRSDVIDQIGRHIRTVLAETYSDLEVGEGELTGWIDNQYQAWTMRRPSWPENCVLAIEAQKKGASDVIYGIRALKPGTSHAKGNAGEICHERDRFEWSLQNVAGGSSSSWSPWYRIAPTPNWSQEFVARLLIESDGRVEEHDDVKKITADLVHLAEAIEAGLQSSQEERL